MTSREFDKKAKIIFDAYSVLLSNNHYQRKIETPVGVLYISVEWNGRNKTGSIFSRLENNGCHFGFDYGLNGKRNFHYRDAENTLGTLEEYVNQVLHSFADEPRKKELNLIYSTIRY